MSDPKSWWWSSMTMIVVSQLCSCPPPPFSPLFLPFPPLFPSLVPHSLPHQILKQIRTKLSQEKSTLYKVFHFKLRSMFYAGKIRISNAQHICSAYVVALSRKRPKNATLSSLLSENFSSAARPSRICNLVNLKLGTGKYGKYGNWEIWEKMLEKYGRMENLRRNLKCRNKMSNKSGK